MLRGMAVCSPLAPDAGDRCPDTLYNDDWVAQHYPRALYDPGVAMVASTSSSEQI